MLSVFQCFGNTCLGVQGLRSAKIIRTVTVKAVMDNRGRRDLASSWKGIQLIKSAQVIKQTVKMYKRTKLKGHSHAILVHFKNQKYVLTSMNAHR